MTANVEIQAFGFIVHGNDAIQGWGMTEESATENMVSNMRLAGIEVVEEIETDEDGNDNEAQTSYDRYTVIPATEAMIYLAQEHGSDVGYYEIKDIACTEDEYKAFYAALADEGEAAE